ncbi:hypothetical protein ACFFMM_27005 [Micromonospora chaiyaphumensis]|uniref:ApbE family protein n=1 Tax=Micromonospora chaiyaphumensis TaxID=307119 RepID=A0A1C4Y5Z9_9ACTN|nr:hypothetical protein [Micromonospora chaiyaphumensis]SCF16157.1 ApbE family protein [Micromonospora chaiyaphumensis]
MAVSDRTALPAARRAVARRLAGLRTVDLELARAHRAAGRPVPVGPLLRDLVAVSLGAAEATGGLVDPTVGAARLRRSVIPFPSRLPGGNLPACPSTVVPPAGWPARWC